MKLDDLNEWQIKHEDDDNDCMLYSLVQKKSSQLILQLPQYKQRRLSLEPKLNRVVSPAKSTRASTSVLDVHRQEGVLSRKFRDTSEPFQALKVCKNCRETIITTNRGALASVRLTDQQHSASTSHINNIILQMNNPEAKIDQPLIRHKSSNIIRIRKSDMSYKSLKMKAVDDCQQTKSSYTSCMPKSHHLHSRKYSELYREAVKNEQKRKEAFKMLPRKKRKKILAKVSPEAPPVQYNDKIDVRPQPLRRDRRMLNFRIEQRKSISHQPELIKENTLLQIMRMRREIKLGIFTSS